MPSLVRLPTAAPAGHTPPEAQEGAVFTRIHHSALAVHRLEMGNGDRGLRLDEAGVFAGYSSITEPLLNSTIPILGMDIPIEIRPQTLPRRREGASRRKGAQ
jgi:hypothetical protein